MKPRKYQTEGRKATWLELFFDLVFVASIADVSHNLACTHDGKFYLDQLILFPVEFLPVWWVWATHMLYANRFDTDGKAHRVGSLAIMFLMVTMSAFLDDGLFEHYSIFIGFYVAIRLALATLYFASQGFAKCLREYVTVMAKVIVTGAIVAGSSLFFVSPFRETVLIVGILYEMAMVMYISLKVDSEPIDREHFVERIGLLTIILLGESVISLVAGLRNITWDPMNVMAAISGFLMIGSIWWIYFDSFHVTDRLKGLNRGFRLLYSHLFLAMGLVILANLIRHTILHDLDMLYFRILAIVGMTFFYIGKQVVYYVSIPIYRMNIFINTVVCIVITIASTFLPRAEYALVGMTLAMFFYTFSNLKWTLSKDASAYLTSH